MLLGSGAFVQAQKPGGGSIQDLWNALNDLEEEVDELKEAQEPQYEMYLFINGIPGEATDEDHDEWIEAIAYHHEFNGPVGGGGVGGSGARPQFEDFEVTTNVDRASPKISLSCCEGRHIEKVILELCYAEGDKDTYMEYEMQEVIITSVSQTGDPLSGEETAKEVVTFSFGRIFWRYTYTDPDTGSQTEYEHFWDVQLNTGH
jgi:type VI secretion system secreted protein Hcp